MNRLAADMTPAEIDRQLRRIHWQIEAGCADAALAELRDVFRSDPSHAPARLIQARACLAAGEPGMALAALDVYQQRAGDHLDQDALDDLLARALAAKGDHLQAADLADRLLNRRPADPARIDFAVGVCLAAGQTEKAQAALRDKLALQPDDAVAALTLADLYLHAGGENLPLAIQTLLSAADHARAPGQRGQLLLAAADIAARAARWADAEALYQQAAGDITPTAEVYLAMARVADAAGDRPTAVARVHRATDLAPLRPAQCRSAATILMHAGDFRRAGLWWWKITREKHYDADAWAGLLICAQLTGHGKLCGRAHRQLSRHAAVTERRDALARMWQHAALGQTVVQALTPTDAPPRQSVFERMLCRAADVLAVASTKHPQHADAHYHHALCRQAQGQTDAARQAVDRALAINPNYSAAQTLKDQLPAAKRVA